MRLGRIRRASTVVLVLLPLLAANTLKVPVTPKRPVADTYHGVKVVDDYRWLEDSKDPAVKDWVAAQNRYTRSYLDQLPGREEIRARLKQIYSARTTRYQGVSYRGGIVFAIKVQPPRQQAFLVACDSPDDVASERVVVDPNKIDRSGGTSIDFYVPSLNAKLVAVALSKGGSEKSDLHIFSVADGAELPDVEPYVNGPTAGGSVAWNADGTGFYYTRYPRGEERPVADRDFYQQVWFHKLGVPIEQDTYILGREFPRIAETELHSSVDGAWVLISTKNGDGGEEEHFVIGRSGQPQQITRFSDMVRSATLGQDGAVYLRSVRNAPRGKILRLSLDDPQLPNAKEVVPESDAVIDQVAATKTRLYVVDMVGGPSRVRVFDLAGKQVGAINTLPVSAVYDVAPLDGDRVLYANGSYLEKVTWFTYDAVSGESKRSALTGSTPVDFSDVEVVREFATSKDGTKVPLNIIRKKGTQFDGTNPVLLTGYGGFGINIVLFVDPSNRIWLDHGFIIAEANLRGGGEFGETWHFGGNLANKQNVFDDFAACAQHLIERKYTTSSKLAIIGGSNGGLLMGAVLTQHPDLFRAVVSFVGIYDMLRVETDPNGAFNVTEYGTVKDPTLFKALYAYSPFHHVKEGTAYPSVLFLTGDNDGRVNPAHSRKMVARLQMANTSNNPVLLRTSANAGHGFGTALDERIEQEVDVASFVFAQLQVN